MPKGKIGKNSNAEPVEGGRQPTGLATTAVTFTALEETKVISIYWLL